MKLKLPKIIASSGCIPLVGPTSLLQSEKVGCEIGRIWCAVDARRAGGRFFMIYGYISLPIGISWCRERCMGISHD